MTKEAKQSDSSRLAKSRVFPGMVIDAMNSLVMLKEAHDADTPNDFNEC